MLLAHCAPVTLGQSSDIMQICVIAETNLSDDGVGGNGAGTRRGKSAWSATHIKHIPELVPADSQLEPSSARILRSLTQTT